MTKLGMILKSFDEAKAPVSKTLNEYKTVRLVDMRKCDDIIKSVVGSDVFKRATSDELINYNGGGSSFGKGIDNEIENFMKNAVTVEQAVKIYSEYIKIAKTKIKAGDIICFENTNGVDNYEKDFTFSEIIKYNASYSNEYNVIDDLDLFLNELKKYFKKCTYEALFNYVFGQEFMIYALVRK